LRPGQLAERRADGTVACGRDECQRIAVAPRIVLEAIETQRCLGLEGGGEEIHFSVRRVGEDVHELNRGGSGRGQRPLAGAQIRANRPGQRVEDANHQIQLAGWFVLAEYAQARAQLAEHVSVRPRLAYRVDDRASQLEMDWAVGLGEVISLEKG